MNVVKENEPEFAVWVLLVFEINWQEGRWHLKVLGDVKFQHT